MSSAQDMIYYPAIVLTDPREAFANPPFSKQKPIKMPLSTSEMTWRFRVGVPFFIINNEIRRSGVQLPDVFVAEFNQAMGSR